MKVKLPAIRIEMDHMELVDLLEMLRMLTDLSLSRSQQMVRDELARELEKLDL